MTSIETHRTNPMRAALAFVAGGDRRRDATALASVPADDADPRPSDDGPSSGLAARLNWLRAGVLGANDGIVSVAALVVGVAAATSDQPTIFIAGVASLLAGAISMAMGEYVSVSTQRDSERAIIERKRRDLAADPGEQLELLTRLYQRKGLTRETAAGVAAELTAHDALDAHLEAGHNLDEADVTNPWHAAIASAISFTIGAILPLLAVLLPPEPLRIPLTFASVVVALAVTGWLSAWLGGANRVRAVLRVTIGGVLALGVTFLIGSLLGVSVA